MHNHDWKRTAWFLLLAAPIVIGYFYNDYTPARAPFSGDSPAITAQSRQHILYGDGETGGHRHSIGTPCKTEFPSYWSEEKIINIVSGIAANNSLPWRLESNGYEVAEDTIDGVEVRVVVDPRANEVVTAYPTDLPQNPCP
ncbi:MAG: EndoU domain-containing protein [Alphaproteobacteria bacterium]|nr:EndoU domain-containing protein [Alphaproteobacteria bacterium]